MLVRKLLLIAAVIGILTITGRAFAQDEPEKPKSFVERLDAFGKTIFNGFRPAKKDVPKPSKASADSESPQQSDSPEKGARVVTRGSMLAEDSDNEPVAPRAGSVLSRPKPESSANDDPTLSMDEFLPKKPPPAVRPQVIERPKPEAHPPVPRSLHERMADFRKSPFESDDEGTSIARVSPPPERPSEPIIQKEKGDSDIESPYPERQPKVAQRVAPGAHPETARPAEPIHDVENDRMAAVQAPAPTSPPLAAEPRPAEKPAGDGTLFSRKGPVLSVETLGPRTIAVGRESTYQVQLTNSGEVAAEELVVHVTLPAWAEVARLKASLGDAKTPEATHAGAIDWKVGRLDAKSREQLTIRIVPRESRPFDLAVRWDYKPIASQAMIEVQEPKLSLKLEGPHEVLYGKKELYRLKLANKGSGGAENVTIVMTPVGTGENMPASHKVGLLAAGEEKSLDVELTAREGGLLTIQAEARADGGSHVELVEKVLVRWAGLELNLTGPKVQFVGAVAPYSIRVRNSGTAPAHNVTFSLALPAGAKYLSGIEGARFDAAENKLKWTVDTLPNDAERTFAIKCRLANVGTSRVRLNAAADDNVAASAETTVRVETVATLTMEVKDPDEPVPVGDEAVYEVRVRNRGTREARNVEVFAYFSRGIEPTATEGAQSRLAPGQVVFQPIALLAPGAEAVLKVRAKAEVEGNHVFRAEARCRQLSARLVSEATNLYYSDSPAAGQMPQNPAVTNVPAPPDNQAQGKTPPLRPLQGTTLTPLLPRE